MQEARVFDLKALCWYRSVGWRISRGAAYFGRASWCPAHECQIVPPSVTANGTSGIVVLICPSLTAAGSCRELPPAARQLGRGTHSDPLGDGGDESECGEIVSGEAVVPCCKASPVLETAEEALDKVATSIDSAIERVRNCSRCGRWNDSLDATDFEPIAQTICIISFIGNQAVGPSDGGQQRHGHADVGNVAWRQREGDRSAAIIGQTMDLRGAASARAPNRLRPFPPFAPAAERCAFTCELSRLSS